MCKSDLVFKQKVKEKNVSIIDKLALVFKSQLTHTLITNSNNRCKLLFSCGPLSLLLCALCKVNSSAVL